MSTVKPMSVAKLQEILTAKGFRSGEVMVQDRMLGRFVTHGHASGNGKTVYASRIYKPFRIQVEAASKGSMLNKIAKELAKGLKERGLTIDAVGVQ